MAAWRGVSYRADGSVLVTALTPIPEWWEFPEVLVCVLREPTVADVEAELTAAQQRPNDVLSDLPYFVVDVAALPAERASACEACGHSHSSRNLWRTDGERVWIDWALRWHHAETDHLLQAIADEVGRADPDWTRVTGLQGLLTAYGAWWRHERSEPPDRRVIERLSRSSRLRAVG